MGMYTELNIGVQFDKNTPKDIIRAIYYMVEEDSDKCKIDFDTSHPLFKTDRWEWMLQSGGSYYFDAQPNLLWKHDTEICGDYFLTFCTNIKNYSQEWEHFLHFIAPHADPGYIGTYRYEEDDLPMLIIIKNKKVKMMEVTK